MFKFGFSLAITIGSLQLFASTQSKMKEMLVPLRLESFCSAENFQQNAEMCSVISENSDQLENQTFDAVYKGESDEDEPIKIRFYFGHAFLNYDKTDISVKTSRLNLQIEDAKFHERDVRKHYAFWNNKAGEGWLKWIDEPTNMAKLSLEYKNNVFVLNIFHPKFVVVGEEGTQNVMVHGTADGQAIHGVKNLSGGRFDQNGNFVPGDLYFRSWMLTLNHMQFGIGYGRKFKLLDKPGFPKIYYTPEVDIGFYTGVNRSSYNKLNKQWEYESYKDDAWRIVGWGATLSNRFEFKNRKENFGVWAEAAISKGHVNYDFMDGKVKHALGYKRLMIGIDFTLFKIKRK